MTLALPPERSSNSDVQGEFDEALARIDKAIIAIRKKSDERKKPPSTRFPGARRLAAQAYLQGAAAETLVPSINGTHSTNGNGVEPEPEAGTEDDD